MIEIKRNGFTLVELIITIIILSIIAGGSAILMSKGLDAFFAGCNMLDADWQGRVAIERMSRELRNIRSSRDVITATGDSIRFIDNIGNDISYYVDVGNARLMRKCPFTGTERVLADGVGLTLTYYDANGAVITAPVVRPYVTDIRYVVITINVTYGGANFNLITGVYPWNLY